MQNFITLAAFFLVEKQGPQREEEEERIRKNAKFYGHYVVLSHALRLDQNDARILLLMNFNHYRVFNPWL